VTGASATVNHVYPTAATYSATLTITDNTNSADLVSQPVSPNFGVGNPVAAFTANCTGVSCVFDASGSTDTGGIITSYTWTFGDGTPPVTTSSPTTNYVYTTPSFYQPTLTVTDNTTSISTTSKLIPVGASTPVAAFSSNCTGLSCSFDATGSTDTGAVITTYSWNFGDGTPVVTGSSPTVMHTYASGSTDHVTLTVLDSSTSTNAITHDVTPGASPPPSTPVAAFTSNCTNLSCAFTDGSSDTGGNITGWSWNFGDGTPVSTTQNPVHVYASAGTGYTVTLTVTDNLTDTNAVSHNVAPTAAPPPSTPAAAFTTNCTLLSCAFTDTSTDTGGNTITGWSWNFGDGTPVSTTQNPVHVYASGGNYTVSLTVTDNLADTNSTNANISPSSGAVTQFASDTFSRTVTAGLGTADVGGAWTRVGGVAADLSVAPGAASFLMPSPSVQDSAYLASVSKTTSEVDTTFTDNNTSTGTAGVYVYVDGRRVSTNNEYDARIRLTPAGGVAVELTKYAGSATATAISSEVTVAGLTFTPGTQINVRFQVSGTSPTTLKVKVWAAGSPQPAAWTITATDTTAGLQAAGAVGLTTYLSGSTTNAPTTVKFSTFSAGPLQP
jgi:PKD repeat protein